MKTPRLPTIESLGPLKGKRLIVRVDFNVPHIGKKVIDGFRITQTLPCLKAVEARAGGIVLLSHITEKKEHQSFRPLVPEFERITKRTIRLAKNLTEARAYAKKIKKGDWVLLENLRVFPEEEKNDAKFARELATLGDAYINEDFSQSHRAYASIVQLPQLLPSAVGPLFAAEVRRLTEVLRPDHPFLLILGGAKFATKVGVLKRFLARADRIFIGGALANTFLYARGLEIGISPCEKNAVADIRRRFGSQRHLILPVDVRVAGKRVLAADAVREKDFIYDAGPATVDALAAEIKKARMVLWNGPLGFTEKGYGDATEELARVLSSARAKVVVGGGDTVVVVRKLKLERKYYHLSTGGGAMLQFLADGTLPGIEALKDR